MNADIGELAIRKLVEKLCAYLGNLSHPRATEVSHSIHRLATRPMEHGEPRVTEACRYLPSALEAMKERTLAAAIEIAMPHLTWNTYDAYLEDDIGPYFTKGHTFATLVGEDAPFPSADFDAGLFLIAPNIFYRDHQHAAPELYVPLTGPHDWRFCPGDKLVSLPAGHPVWNGPWQPHATRVGLVPFLSVYAWTSDVSTPACVIPSPDWPDFEKSAINCDSYDESNRDTNLVYGSRSMFS